MAVKEADQEFVEYVVKQIVSKPEGVSTNRSIDELGVLVELTVDRDDMGVVIGKEGKTAKAIRTLLRVLGAKNDSRINMKIVEPEGSEPRVAPEKAEEFDIEKVQEVPETPEVEVEKEVEKAPVVEEEEEEDALMADLDI